MRVMTLGSLPALRRQHYGVGSLEQRPLGTFFVLAGVAGVLIAGWLVYDRVLT